MPELDGQESQQAAVPAPAPEAPLAIPGGPRDYQAEMDEAIRLANEEGERLRAEAAADTRGAEGGTTAPGAPDQATPARPAASEEQAAAQTAEEEGEQAAPSGTEPTAPPEHADIHEALRAAGFSRNQRKALLPFFDQVGKKAAETALAEAKTATETANRLQQEATERQQTQERANAGLTEFLGDEQEFQELQKGYDADELDWQQKARYIELRDRRRFGGAIRQNLWGGFNRDLQVSDEIEGVEPGLWNSAPNLREYALRVATGHAAAKVAQRDGEWRQRESAWKVREDDLEGQIEEHEATIKSLQTGLAAKGASPEAGGRTSSVPHAAVLQTLISQAGSEENFVERALRGDFAGVDLSAG